MLSKFSMTVDTLSILSPVPNIPFVECQVIAFLAANLCLSNPAKRVHDLDLLIDGIRDCQIVCGVSLPFGGITVQAYKISIIANVFQCSPIPLHISWKTNFSRAADNQFDGRIN